MLEVQVKGLKEVQKQLKNMKKQVKFATAMALTKTAKKVKAKEQAEMKKTYKNPKPFTLNSVYVVAANKKQSEPFAIIGIKDQIKSGTPAAKYLKSTIKGGKRRLKKAEAALKGKGILPSGYYVVPGKGLRLNRFGNITKGQIGKAMTANTRGGKFFVGKAGKGKTMGVWQRKGRKGKSISPFMIFVKNTNYKRQFQFYVIAEKEVDKHLDKEFIKAFEHAMRTAR